MLQRHVLTALMIATMLSGCGRGLSTMPKTVTTAHLASNANQSAPRYANRLLMRFKDSASDSQMRAVRARFHLSSVGEVGELRMASVGLAAGSNTASTMAAIQADPDVAYAEPDFVMSVPKPVLRPATRKVQAVANDPQFPQQWGMVKIGMPQTWPVNAGASGVIVAVVDTGVDLHHPDLTPNLVPGTCVIPGASGPDDDHGHGTHCAGIIAAATNNGIGVTGVAPNCKIMPVKVLGADGKGDTLNIIAGIIWAANNGAKVISMSLGGTGGSRGLADAIAYAQSKDCVCVAAMGNDGANSQEYPAGYPGVIAVGATDSQDQLADFSNYGTWASVCAPGVDILSTLPTHRVTVNTEEGKSTSYDSMDGTSMATPYVAGVAALVRSAFPTLTAAQVKARIERTADDLGKPGFDDQFGWGRINAARAARPD